MDRRWRSGEVAPPGPHVRRGLHQEQAKVDPLPTAGQHVVQAWGAGGQAGVRWTGSQVVRWTG